ncbi:ester cyclase [Pusillimonas sp.]|uniref:ester cyclase n=1 Tax=Pusillimonas sp. TaxID=3040095 RepID=UPI0037CA1CD6
MSPKETVKAFIDAHNDHDIEKMMSYFADDCITLDVASPIPLDSNADVVKLYEYIFAAMPDIHFEISSLIEEGNKAFAALRTTANGTGVFMGNDITGKRCDVFEGMYAEVVNGKIKLCKFYSDTATLSKQLGYKPALDMSADTPTLM